MNRFAEKLTEHRLDLRHTRTEILQINVGKLCNLTCNHCHVNAGPKRKEIITRETIDRILSWLEKTDVDIVDLTGGAPEMIPDFRYFVSRIREMGRHIIDRCNLTILLEPGYEGTAEFLAEHQVEIVASMPCYSRKNVDAQRGNGVFQNSITALRHLNSLGYGPQGTDPGLPLHLVYNPGGAFLPGPQAELQAEYEIALSEDFGIRFNRLYTITNMAISRFAAWLKHSGELEDYEQLLFDSFNPATVDGLMCKNTLNIGWRGEVYDCDFNQMLGMQWKNGTPKFLWDINPAEVENRLILTGDHCFGCTAGTGSSCGGSVI